MGDKLDAPASVFSATITSNVGNVSSLSAASIASVLNSKFVANTAKTFTATGYAGTFVAFNDGIVGYATKTDSIIFLEGHSITSTPVVVI